MIVNSDGFALQNGLIDPQAPLPPMQQALRIALYDEYRAQATYRRVCEQHGEHPPFSTIAQAEARHIEHLLALFAQYGVPPVADDWYPRIRPAPTWVENCELGVAGEIGNIMMYDRLLPYAQAADVQDAFFRLQAASYNHHLPAFRHCLQQLRNASGKANRHAEEPPAAGLTNQLQHLWQQFQAGQLDPSTLPGQLQPLLGQLSSSFVWGALAGAGFGAVLGSQFSKRAGNDDQPS